MFKILCSVLDSTVGAYANPFTSANEASAIRDFGHACHDPDSMLYKSPADYSLALIGHFNDETGEIERSTLKTLCTAVQFSKKEA